MGRLGGLGVEPDTKTRRVFRIVHIMNTGGWAPKVGRELAKEWSLAVSTVQVMACEAKRILDITLDDRKELVKGLELRLLEIATLNDPDRVQAIRTQFEHLGELRKRLEVSGPGGADIPVGVSAKVVVLPAEEADDDGGAGDPPG